MPYALHGAAPHQTKAVAGLPAEAQALHDLVHIGVDVQHRQVADVSEQNVGHPLVCRHVAESDPGLAAAAGRRIICTITIFILMISIFTRFNMIIMVICIIINITIIIIIINIVRTINMISKIIILVIISTITFMTISSPSTS